MRMYNLDGSEGGTSGNALRCVGKYLYENGLALSDTVTVETRTGIRTLKLYVQNGKVEHVVVNMGKAKLRPWQIPVLLQGEQVVNTPVEIDGTEYRITCLSMGNPHCVVFTKYPNSLELEKIGPSFETAPIFPGRVNTEFVHVIDDHTLKMRVWERGNGETLACWYPGCLRRCGGCGAQRLLQEGRKHHGKACGR